ncbi:calmodulin-alpha isoform X2 [Drosophila busckii]|uniref:calmodulin-alpha isoform X2 n=1 Tax=Drosophila busckii TaxID=30019 RepID=UPI00083E9FE9|nr:calmodulin-alpha isoform X2 [Drosophila busckii]
MWQITDEQEAELREVFAAYDVNGDGIINAKELALLMHNTGHQLTESELYELIDSVCKDGTRELKPSEFIAMMAPRLKDIESVENLRRAFEVFDRNGDGFFDAHDVRFILSTLGEIVDEEHCKLIMDELGASTVQLICYTENLQEH